MAFFTKIVDLNLCNNGSLLMLFVVGEHTKDRKDVYNNTNFDSMIVRFRLLADVADFWLTFIIHHFLSFICPL